MLKAVALIITRLSGKLNFTLAPLLLQYAEHYGFTNEFGYDVGRNLEILCQNGTPLLPVRAVDISFTLRCCLAHQNFWHLHQNSVKLERAIDALIRYLKAKLL